LGEAKLAKTTPCRDADQLAVKVVGPLVIRADELLRRAAVLLAILHAAMGAAVDQHVDFAGGVAHRDAFAPP
jgi:predicted nucleic acid-binding Zn ribbon protein